jgi:hypothetical protein
VLLTISTTVDPATDLGFLLHKHPEKVHSFPVTAGKAHVLYPEATARRCTAVLSRDVDPVALVQSARGQAAESFTLGQYVNDRPYAASSMLAVALSKVFKTAMAANLDRLRDRGLGTKRVLAAREYALGLEALDRLAAGEPLWRVHERVFAVLALESEPVDPRL